MDPPTGQEPGGTGADGARARLVGEALGPGHFAHLVGRPETEVARAFKVRALQAGVDQIGYLALGSGPGGYDSITRPPGERVLREGDVLALDAGGTVGGDWCDFNRNVALGDPAPEAVSAYARLYDATEVGIQAARPGARASDVWRAMADVLGPGMAEGESASRFGHGVGLGFTEPPSVHPADHTRLVPGMVLAIEPGLVYPVAGRLGPRLMVHEENIVVTPDGARLLTERAPASLPVVPAFLQENT